MLSRSKSSAGAFSGVAAFAGAAFAAGVEAACGTGVAALEGCAEPASLPAPASGGPPGPCSNCARKGCWAALSMLGGALYARSAYARALHPSTVRYGLMGASLGGSSSYTPCAHANSGAAE